MLRRRHHLAGKQRAESAVALRRTIRRHHVHELVVHQVVHAFVGGERLVGEAERREARGHEVVRTVAALPESEKSVSSTVMRSDGV